ncbi:hypothetical protein AMAG_15219 [Allomyces macrogynus ATCC 38327]|uniref:Uncharacterized protein n=1 Tax=Allomyces macrogynus (strain ATCC 38327) TaxID=578462 RepID=A0A0L0T8C3_ALLM3|nr:hypothetical protein AMAG_15219 [Allomyces macrogynus ATCC 38327]|eukprot:KNE70955.1 hypothetical protein AMAG_15219 [Allomyces macrogynus ATCC 38327]
MKKLEFTSHQSPPLAEFFAALAPKLFTKSNPMRKAQWVRALSPTLPVLDVPGDIPAARAVTVVLPAMTDQVG